MERHIKTFYGHSGSFISLKENDAFGKYIYKQYNVARNVERLSALSNVVNVPQIYEANDDMLKMEYIHGLDMKTYLKFNDTRRLLDFITTSMNIFRKNEMLKDYGPVYEQALDWMKEQSIFPFTKKNLIEKLPKTLPQSNYHGDMTLENIIQRTDGEFFFIDAVTVPYDSWIFDIAKLRQDLECKWFLRKDNIMLDAKLKDLQSKILAIYPEANNDYLLIAMLLRVFLHCQPGSLEYNFIVKEVYRLWK